MAQRTRIERDALGTLAVPAKALWGIHSERARGNFPMGGGPNDPALVRAIALVKEAAARANGRLGRLEEAPAEAIARAAAELAAGVWSDQIVVDVFSSGAGTALHMNVNEVLANRANQLLGEPLGQYRPVHPNDHVNAGQSTNDVMPAAMRLAALELGKELDAAIAALAHEFEERAHAFHDVLKAGRTHLQDAVPLRLGQEVRAYAATVDRARRVLVEALGPMHELGLGGTAVGTGLNAPPGFAPAVIEELRRLAQQPDLHLAPDRFEAMQSAAPFVGVSAGVRTLAIEVGRICNDLRLLASGPRTGLHELVLPAVQPGSSIMPGKINPTVAEVVNQICYQVIGQDATVAAAAGAGQLELNVMLPAIAHAMLGAMRLMTRACEILALRCVAGIRADVARCQAYAHTTVGLATVLNPLVGYAEAAEVAKQSEREGRSIPEVVRERGTLDAEQLRVTFSPERLADAGAPQEPQPDA